VSRLLNRFRSHATITQLSHWKSARPPYRLVARHLSDLQCNDRVPDNKATVSSLDNDENALL
jgi:hypothetical protein